MIIHPAKIEGVVNATSITTSFSLAATICGGSHRAKTKTLCYMSMLSIVTCSTISHVHAIVYVLLEFALWDSHYSSLPLFFLYILWWFNVVWVFVSYGCEVKVQCERVRNSNSPQLLETHGQTLNGRS